MLGNDERKMMEGMEVVDGEYQNDRGMRHI
jgi:hypothetical protein